MPAIIEEIINPQGFELVRDRIVEILVLELAKQKELQPSLSAYNVYSERRTPVDNSEGVVVNVLLDNATYENFGPSSSQGTTIYNIDVYAKGLSSQETTGYLEAAKKVHRFIGLCRYILQSTKYKTLSFPDGFIGGVYARNLQVYDAGLEGDASKIQMARLNFAVKITDNQDLWQGISLDSTKTEIKLELTEKGYKYELINN